MVSAQNRERFYVHNCGEVGQPKDRRIPLKDVLESGVTWKDKQNTIDANYFKGGNFTNMQKQSGQRFAVAEPIRIPEYTHENKSRPVIAGYSCKGDGEGSLLDKCFPDNPNKQKVDYVAEPCIFQQGHGYNDGGMKYGKAPTLTANGWWQENNKVVEPIQIGVMPALDGNVSQSQGSRIYDINAKSVSLKANGGGGGAKTGLYAVPINALQGEDKARTLTANYWKCSERDAVVECAGGRTMCVTNYAYVIEFDSDGKPTKAYCYADGKIHIVYEVKDRKITIKGKEYPIKLPDGFYIIRKLTVTECCRLQGMPEWWFRDKDGNKLVSDTQAYKGLGNGWQLDTVKYILEHALRNIPKYEPILLLSLYDGIGTGRRILEELGFTNVKYVAYEIDKYCIALTKYRYPDVTHKGDAFQVRNDDWKI